MWSTTFEHLFQLCGMAAILWGSRAFSVRTQGERTRREGQRLRMALAISLQALHNHYENNLRISSGGKMSLSSGRNQINLLRTQLGRLTLLDTPEVEAVMAASVAAEVAETQMIRSGSRSGGSAFTIPEGPVARTLPRSTLRDACSALQAAEELLNSNYTVRLESKSNVPPSCTIDWTRHTKPLVSAANSDPHRTAKDDGQTIRRRHA
jgi:hypothetical protein